MTEIYQAIAGLRSKFKKMSFAFTTDENEIDNAVQELMLYFLQMNPKTLKNIYEKDGEDGLTRYGAVALRRSFTSPRSKFYYTYNKYYNNIDELTSNATYVYNNIRNSKSLYNIPNEVLDFCKFEKLEQIDEILDSLEYWYDKKIFQLYYYEGNTLDSLAKKTGISRNSLFSTIDKVRNKIKEEIE
ncbi:MAG: hypothetical protein CMC55_00460 [Flavobacteriaceae bacterium]|nr:hypothetical protein [Flavobacteriaceae bacterium]